MKRLPCLALAVLAATTAARADENLFGYTRGAETLPAGKTDAYTTVTQRNGKQSGSYHAWDIEPELEYGVTDRLQVSGAVNHHHFHVKDVPDYEDQNRFVFGGGGLAAKVMLASPFSSSVGVATRSQLSYFMKDDVGGIHQKELVARQDLILQKNFLDNTLVTAVNLGAQWATGKRPAEAYENELSAYVNAGASYRFAPGWYAGLETATIWMYPRQKTDGGTPHLISEHYAIFAGPALHYGAERWWITLSWVYQVYGWGEEGDQVKGTTYAEEARNQLRLKVGFNL